MIHCYCLYGTKIVLDVNSGAVHLFDDVSYDAIKEYEKLKFNDVNIEDTIVKKLEDRYDLEEIREALSEIKVLEKEGLLFSEDLYKTNPGVLKTDGAVKAMCLHVSHDCNMRCGYCFASSGDFGTGRKVMDLETAKKAVDFLVESSKGKKNIEIDFFGGEPLMNFDVVKKTVEYTNRVEKHSSKNFRLTMTTNALLLDEEKMNYINRHFDNVVLSLDGRIGTNDRMRKLHNGQGSYNRIIGSIKKMADKRRHMDYYVRGTYTAFNTDFCTDVLHMADMGIRNISVEPVVAAYHKEHSLDKTMLPLLKSEYERLALEYVKRRSSGNPFTFFHFMIDLEQGPCVTKRLKGCGAGYEYIAVTPEGDIYPCHQFVGQDGFKLGNVEYGIKSPEMVNSFKNSNIYTKDKCTDCWAKFYCGGGCDANSQAFNNSLNKPYELGCELEKKRIECAIWIKAFEKEV